MRARLLYVQCPPCFLAPLFAGISPRVPFADAVDRWSINAISWLHETSDKFGEPVPNFDEPFVSLGWPARIAPHRVGMVGEALFVHMQYTRQRSSKPDYGLHEGVLLPWYKELQEQYVKTKWGEWPGNHSLIEYHERLATAQGMRRFGKD